MLAEYLLSINMLAEYLLSINMLAEYLLSINMLNILIFTGTKKMGGCDF